MSLTGDVFWTRIVPVVSVVAIATGQLLFKQVAVLTSGPAGLRSPAALAVLVAALVIYGAATLAWIGALRHAPLSSLYPIMALSFVLVPIGGALIFRERLSLTYGLGCLLLVAGIIVIGRATAILR